MKSKDNFRIGPSDLWKKIRIDQWEKSNKSIPLDVWLNTCRTGLFLYEILPYVMNDFYEKMKVTND